MHELEENKVEDEEEQVERLTAKLPQGHYVGPHSFADYKFAEDTGEHPPPVYFSKEILTDPLSSNKRGFLKGIEIN